MNRVQEIERRKHQRFPLCTGISFFHGPARRDFPGRSVDISESGLMMLVSPSTPVQVGQYIRVSVAAVPRPEFAGQAGQPRDATIVRVDRAGLLNTGRVSIGVKFNNA